MRPKTDIKKSLDNSIGQIGGLAQLVERVLSMHEVGSSILPFSTGFAFCMSFTRIYGIYWMDSLMIDMYE